MSESGKEVYQFCYRLNGPGLDHVESILANLDDRYLLGFETDLKDCSMVFAVLGRREPNPLGDVLVITLKGNKGLLHSYMMEHVEGTTVPEFFPEANRAKKGLAPQNFNSRFTDSEGSKDPFLRGMIP
jgi:hypothetical protein